jgi:hypothetical protein
MARTRAIRPGFFTNELLGELPPLVRLLFSGMWTLADREGRLLDRPKKIKAELLPYDNMNADKALDQLAGHGFIIRYEVAAERYIQVVNWSKHQHPHPREDASKIPALDGYTSDSGEHLNGDLDDPAPGPRRDLEPDLGAPPDTDRARLVASSSSSSSSSRSFNSPYGEETPPTPPDEQGGHWTSRRGRQRVVEYDQTPTISPQDEHELWCCGHVGKFMADCAACRQTELDFVTLRLSGVPHG